jgi:hypothetical protein
MPPLKRRKASASAKTPKTTTSNSTRKRVVSSSPRAVRTGIREYGDEEEEDDKEEDYSVESGSPGYAPGYAEAPKSSRKRKKLVVEGNIARAPPVRHLLTFVDLVFVEEVSVAQ